MAEGMDLDVAVIGAGAAGLAAARTLVDAGIDTLVVEARPRVGGRAWTALHVATPLDLGCGWLHSAEVNPWTTMARRMGFTVDRTPSRWGEQYHGLGFSPAEQEAFHEAATAFYARLGAAAHAGAEGRASGLLDPGGRWNALLGAIGTYIDGAELDRISIIDHERYADTQANWRVREGYGTAVAAMGHGLALTLDCPVTTVDSRGPCIRLATPHGDILARAVVVTVPTTVLATERLTFLPARPDKLAAAHGLPLGVANKLMLRVKVPEHLPQDAHVFGSTTRVATGSYHLRPLGRPTVEGYYGGELAKELERGGIAAFTAFALDELAGLFGAEIRAKLEPIVATAWSRDPFSLGSYSHALPGHADDRQVLAADIDGRIYFAGEACSRHDYSTAHGAYRTGVAAARAIIAARAG
ncbi:flavin monoamine oxidase family protein [Chelatococcus reniformis]|uniref:Tryptophan 2-monooxygenase n=1 Tax=Chelatococcus reniformis TaxID=1494448 RepID=A0A916XFN8_9HYPH|nr:FAD-dependent oxidoreductase [Chelatococcus reniformis]GGC69905.1 amine oxidase [Chelatococcus reniformis]